MIPYFQKRPHLIILGLILLTGLFFRSFQVIERFEFAHDGDLYSWIVKDILVNGHFRLIGQLTSAPGIFIGPLFYYLLVPFFLITGMEPVGVVILAILTGLLAIFSYYFVLSKLFRKEVGLIAAFLYAVLLATAASDRWVVPTITTSLWAIWYFYSILMISRGSFSVLPILGVLIGLIWHVHIAIIPALTAIPVALMLSSKVPSFKQTVKFILALFIVSLPLIIFELRHNFLQTSAFLNNFFVYREGPTGLYKLQLVTEMITKNINALFFTPQSFNFTNNFFFVLIILLSALAAAKADLISFKQVFTLYAWIFGVILFFFLSSSPISEYYFINIHVIFIAIISLLLYLLFRSSLLGKVAVFLLLSLLLIKNVNFLITQDFYHKGYLEKKKVVEFISEDAQRKGYPCIGISYITSPGENVGFRYLLYLKKLHLVHPSLNVPVYNIVIPDELALEEVKQKFGHIGIIPPVNIPAKEVIQTSCKIPNTNITDSMFGYVE